MLLRVTKLTADMIYYNTYMITHACKVAQHIVIVCFRSGSSCYHGYLSVAEVHNQMLAIGACVQDAIPRRQGKLDGEIEWQLTVRLIVRAIDCLLNFALCGINTRVFHIVRVGRLTEGQNLVIMPGWERN